MQGAYKKLTIFLAMSALCSCSMIPAFERPAPIVPKDWPIPPFEATAEGHLPKAHELAWQTFFKDERLKKLIECTLRNNQDMRLATAHVREAMAAYGIVYADRLPSVNLGASSASVRTPKDLTLFGKDITSHRQDIGLNLSGFELDFWGRIAAMDEAAYASYLATEEARTTLHTSLVAMVADSYFLIKELEERLELTEYTFENRSRMLELVELMYEKGAVSQLDILQAKAAVDTAKADLVRLQQQYGMAQNALTLLLGTAPPDDTPDGLDLMHQDLTDAFDMAIPSEVLLHRPDVRAAEQKLLAANANIGAARAAFLPNITLNLSLGTASRSISGLFENGSGVWSFTPTLVQPIFNAGRLKSNLDLAETRKDAAVAEYEKTIQQAFREVADALVSCDRLAAALNIQERLLATQTQRLKTVEERYTQGIASHLEVLDAQRDQYAAQMAVVQVRRQLLSARVQLYRALGGGHG
ncbi:MAG: efflux transporter outer membrane subunit [Dissulfuribacterales bacterium]